VHDADESVVVRMCADELVVVVMGADGLVVVGTGGLVEMATDVDR